MPEPQKNAPLDDRSEVTAPGKPRTALKTLRQGSKYISLLLLSAIASCSFGYLAAKEQLPTTIESPAAASPKLADSRSILADANTNFITQVVDRVGSAVVRINASTTTASRPAADDSEDPFFRRFFGNRVPQTGQQPREIRQGIGSGFILNNNGQILTNAHVVAGATKVTVTLKDGRTVDGKVKGIDRVTDVAVVEIAEKNLPSIQLGNSEQIKPGEWAIAIGNPLGLDNTVTAGIVSGTGRTGAEIGAADKRVNYIQTDAAINHGNGGAQGLGFAIPINTAVRIANQLIATGKVDHPFLGVQMVDLTPQLKQEINTDSNVNLKIDIDNGTLVARVVKNSPAATAGMRSGDIIESVDGKIVQNSNQVQQAVETTKIGNSVPIKVRRNGQDLSLNVTPVAAPPITAEPE